MFVINFDGHHIDDEFYNCLSGLLQQFPCRSTIYQIDRIQTVLNDAARLVFGGFRRNHVTPVLRDRLHWLRALQRIQFKVALLAYKAMNE